MEEKTLAFTRFSVAALKRARHEYYKNHRFDVVQTIDLTLAYLTSMPNAPIDEMIAATGQLELRSTLNETDGIHLEALAKHIPNDRLAVAIFAIATDIRNSAMQQTG